MAKKIVALTVLSLFFFIGCSTGKYSDMKSFMNDVIDAQEDYASDLEGASNAKDIVDAMNSFADKMEGISKRGEELEKKYPDFSSKNIPSELKPEFERLGKVTGKIIKLSMKNMKYMMSPEVMKATQNLAKKAGKSKMFGK